ncbi:cilia- and flagella-associated protein 77 isoform X2 [Xyrichtys novacula]|uniref:Cilia- and flagella-associated protein 77 isoform X2 n=1 Tax=Xyrichtys novacula TaxID=13765 RepID=A0AAV1G7T8_XYRNO|nr:cilia- and flagella-associated protein 77 isoform X2 [Xyrichtys novacula]
MKDYSTRNGSARRQRTLKQVIIADVMIAHRRSMSSPRLGVVRDSMLINPRLIQAPLGKSMSRGLSLPGPDFTYGTTSSSIRGGGMAEVLSSWKVQPSREDSAPHRTLVPHFVSLNRDAVKSGVVTSKELSQYRAQRAEAMSQSHAPRKKDTLASRRLVVPDITFGVPNRPSTPLEDLLSHQYGRRWLDQQLSRSQNCIQQQQKLQRIKSKDNRTSLLRRSKPLPVTQTPFKLPRFAQVGPALDTFRDQEARQRAFKTHQSDSVSRRGVQGLGTYSLD